jgi:hypothetical protein
MRVMYVGPVVPFRDVVGRSGALSAFPDTATAYIRRESQMPDAERVRLVQLGSVHHLIHGECASPRGPVSKRDSEPDPLGVLMKA